MKSLFVIAFLLTPEAPYLPAYLDRIEGTTERYADCVSLIADDLTIGRRAAERWVTEGGGAPALHCLAVADLAAGFPKLAATRLTEISERTDAGDSRARARLLAEAALAWLDAKDTEQAKGSILAAMRLTPELPELDFVAAKVYAAAGEWQAASDAVTAAEEAGLIAIEAFLIRARAARALGRDEDAANDVVAALTIDPYNVDALTMRGELMQAGFNIEAYYGEDEEEE